MEPKLTNVETTMFEENIRKYPNWNEDDIIITEISQMILQLKKQNITNGVAQSIKQKLNLFSKVNTAKHQLMQALHIVKFTTNGIKKEKFTLKFLMLSKI